MRYRTLVNPESVTISNGIGWNWNESSQCDSPQSSNRYIRIIYQIHKVISNEAMIMRDEVILQCNNYHMIQTGSYFRTGKDDDDDDDGSDTEEEDDADVNNEMGLIQNVNLISALLKPM